MKKEDRFYKLVGQAVCNLGYVLGITLIYVTAFLINIMH